MILAIICLIKNNIKDENEIEENNSYKNFTFYKEENLNRYQTYQAKTKLDYKTTILYVNIGLDQEFYSNIKEAPNINNNYVLVNKYNYLTSNYVPSNLVKLDEFARSGIYLVNEAYQAFKLMARDASIQGLNLRIVSAYRSYEYQQNLYNSYLAKDSQEVVDTYSARAGYSEHQTGLAVDIDNTRNLYTNFEKTDEFKWMQDNCYKYGFILRYPKDKEHITGYMYEPWHYRYIGIKESTFIYKNNLTYEEYYYEFLD